MPERIVLALTPELALTLMSFQDRLLDNVGSELRTSTFELRPKIEGRSSKFEFETGRILISAVARQEPRSRTFPR